MEGTWWEIDRRVVKPPHTQRAALWHGLVEISTLICPVSSLWLGGREAGETQHVCV